MIDREIMRKLLSVEDFPTLPEIMTSILEATANDATSTDQLTSIIERDHAIAVRILRMANSAFFGLRSPVLTTRQAIVVLGFNAVRLLALATSVFDTLSRRKQFALDPTDFWMHSFGAAKAAQLLAQRQDGLNSEECFTSGLIHDMGKYAMAIALQHEYRDIIEMGKETQRPLREIELAELNTTSEEVGAWLGEKWKLPPSVLTVIRNSPRAPTYTGPNGPEVVTVALGNQISCVTGFGRAGDYSTVIDNRLANIVDLSSDDVVETAEEVTGLIDETRQFLGALGEV